MSRHPMMGACVLLLLACRAALAADPNAEIVPLRDDQAAARAALRAEYSAKYQQATTQQQKDAIAREYNVKQDAIRRQFTQKDQRPQYLQDMNAKLRQQGLELRSTGGEQGLYTKNPNADWDGVIVKTDGSKPTPAELDKGYQIVEQHMKDAGAVYQDHPHRLNDLSRDVTVYQAPTADNAPYFRADPDSHVQEGAKFETGVPGAVRDADGAVAGQYSKFQDARYQGDLQQMGKAVYKSSQSEQAGPQVARFKEVPGGPTADQLRQQYTDADGNVNLRQAQRDGNLVIERSSDPMIAKDPTRGQYYDQAERLYKGQDDIEAGINQLGQTPQQDQAGMQAWAERAPGEIKAIGDRRLGATEGSPGHTKGEIRDMVRQQAEQGYATAADPEVRAVAGQVKADRAAVADSNYQGQRKIDALEKRTSADEIYAGGWQGKPPPDGGGGSGGTGEGGGAGSGGPAAEGSSAVGPAAVHEMSPVTQQRNYALRGGHADTPTEHRALQDTKERASFAEQKPESQTDVMSAVAVAGQVANAGANEMGQAVDEGRDVSLMNVARDASGIGMYDVGKQRYEDERRAYGAGEQSHLEAGAKAAVKTLVYDVGGAESAARNLVEDMDRAEREKGGRLTMGEAAVEYGKAMSSIANPVELIARPFVEADAEYSTLDERANWAAQKQVLGQSIDDKLTSGTRDLNRLATEIDRLASTGDPNDPAAARRMDEAMGEYMGKYEQMRDLVGMAQRTLGREDPDRVKNVYAKLDSVIDPHSMRSSAADLFKERGGEMPGTSAEVESRLLKLDQRINDPDTPPSERVKAQWERKELIKGLTNPAPDAGPKPPAAGAEEAGEETPPPEEDRPTSDRSSIDTRTWEVGRQDKVVAALEDQIGDLLKGDLTDPENHAKLRELLDQHEQEFQKREELIDEAREAFENGELQGDYDAQREWYALTRRIEDAGHSPDFLRMTSNEESMEQGGDPIPFEVRGEILDVLTGGAREGSATDDGEPGADEEWTEDDEQATILMRGLRDQEEGDAGGEYVESDPDEETPLEWYANEQTDTAEEDQENRDLSEHAREVSEASYAGFTNLLDADRVRDQGGREAQQTLDASARKTAEDEARQSWGATLGDAAEKVITTGLQKTGEGFSRAAAAHVADEAFGTSSGASSGCTDTHGGTTGSEKSSGVTKTSTTSGEAHHHGEDVDVDISEVKQALQELDGALDGAAGGTQISMPAIEQPSMPSGSGSPPTGGSITFDEEELMRDHVGGDPEVMFDPNQP